eukprot:SM000351S13217  [mRNA]  locus=s351:60462:63655:- [translate_table: standard]
MELLELPQDALDSVLLRLDYRSALSAAAVCRRLRAVAADDKIWMALCHPWAPQLDLQVWRSKASSARSLFRLLRELDRLIGAWGCSELHPRGGLLYISWGHYKVEACRVLRPPDGAPLACARMPLFEVAGLPDGAAHVTLLMKQPSEATLPGKLLWDSSQGHDRFHLEAVVPAPQQASDAPVSSSSLGEPTCGHHQNGSTAHDVRARVEQERRHTDLQQQQLMHNMWLGAWVNVVGGRFAQDPMLPGYRRIGPLDHSIQYIHRLSFQQGASSHQAEEDAGLLSPNKCIKVPKSSYVKLEMPAVPGESLAGLWTGIYGPHGMEVLNLVYLGTGELEARKVLGDPNVPCGEVSFKVDLASRKTDFAGTLDPVQLHAMLDQDWGVAGEQQGDHPGVPEIAAIYEGKGRVAGYNFHHPQWVDGELLVGKQGSIAFFWKDVNFAIRFRRLNLASIPILDPSA